MSEWKQLYAEVIDREPPARLAQRVSTLAAQSPSRPSTGLRLRRVAGVSLAGLLIVAVLGLLFLAAHSRRGAAPAPAGSASADQTLSGGGVQVTAPRGWVRVAPANDAPITDPRTLLVVGTAGVQSRASGCQVAKYDVQPDGAVVVVVGWKPGEGSEGSGSPGQHRTEFLRQLRGVHRPAIECFAGRGTAGDINVNNRNYGVYVMVGDQATSQEVADALSVARSFRVSSP
jgi:hypothetical protein